MKTTPAPAMGAPAGPPRPLPDPRMRALEFQRELEDSLAGAIERTGWGVVVRTDELPRVTGLNVLRVEGVGAELDAAALMQEADVRQAGLPHRAIRVESDAAAAHLAPDFVAAGWTFERTAVMVLRRRPDRPIDTSVAAPVELERIRGARAAAVGKHHRDLDVAAEAVAAGSLEKDGATVSAIAAIVGGEVAAYCLIRHGREASKLVEVEALERAHGRGVGNAVIAAAASAARAALPIGGVVFAECEQDEWAKAIYRRLGFDERSAMYRFIRPWGDDAPPPPPL